ncbi:MAG: hypothetical protein U5K77_02290 [Candidatus Saccharibacteria bacterium]|nr:hypothetical protein [Candidatus Saccharibacteria bacterium]
MTEQLNLPMDSEPTPPEFDADAVAEHIAENATEYDPNTRAQQRLDRSGVGGGIRAGVDGDLSRGEEPAVDVTQETTVQPQRGTHEAPSEWRMTDEERAAAPAGIIAAREALSKGDDKS